MDFQLLMTAVCNSKIVSFLCYLVQPYTVSGVRFVVVGGGGGGLGGCRGHKFIHVFQRVRKG